MIVGQAAIKLPITEIFEAFQAQLIKRKVPIGPCLARETTFSNSPEGYVQSSAEIRDDSKADAKEFANYIADRANGKRVSFACLVLPRGVEAANRIEQDQISIRIIAEKNILTEETMMQADVLFTTGETKP